MLLSQKVLRRILGAMWLIDGLLQLQPQMFTANMINGVMAPLPLDQPGPIAASLDWIITFTTVHLALVNWLIALVQISLGLLLLSGKWVRETVMASIVWALIVWYGGEGMSLLLTGHGSALTGAPGAVLLYPLLGLAVLPRDSLAGGAATGDSASATRADGVLSRLHLRWILAGFWIFAGLLQLQGYWWQAGQISQNISAMVGQGGLNSVLVDPVLSRLADLTANIEIPLNIALIVACFGIGIGLALVRENHVRPWLVTSIVVSLLIWYSAEAFGMIFSGMATDFNSGLLLVVMALACWPKESYVRAMQGQVARPAVQPQSTGSVQSA